jgi:hypothetical protein
MLPPPGMVNSPPLQNVFMVNFSHVKTTNLFVLTGNSNVAVTANTITNTTPVLNVVKPLTELKHALKLRKLKVLTPYQPDTWQCLLTQAAILLEYPHILDSLWFSFYVKLPSILSTERLCLLSQRENLEKGGKTNNILMWERAGGLN